MRSSFKINPEHMMPEMYGYPFPEVREIIEGIDLNPRFTMNTLPVNQAIGYLASYDYKPRLELPVRRDGSVDLDEIHSPVIDRIQTKMQELLPGLDTFDHRYPCHGSSPSMFALIAEWHAQGKLDSIAVVNGEYEGYSAYAETLNVPINIYDGLDGNEPKAGEVWFVSNPSAIDGNWIDSQKWRSFVDAGHEIVYDAAYVGLTSNDVSLDVSAPNIRAILTSPSKTFGVFRYRNTGVTYTREPAKSLYGTKWFKDVPALLDTLKLYESFTSNELPKKYAETQRKICDALSDYALAKIVPSDVLLLATTIDPMPEEYSSYRRGDGHRFGLTKFFEDSENS